MGAKIWYNGYEEKTVKLLFGGLFLCLLERRGEKLNRWDGAEKSVYLVR